MSIYPTSYFSSSFGNKLRAFFLFSSFQVVVCMLMFCENRLHAAFEPFSGLSLEARLFGLDGPAIDDSRILFEIAQLVGGLPEVVAPEEEIDAGPASEEALYAEMLEHVYLGEVDSLRGFLDAHPDLNINHVYQNGDEGDPLHNFTLLHQAALHDYRDMVKFLLKRGATAVLNLGDSRSRTPLYLAMRYGDYFNMVNILINAGARLDLPDENGVLPEHYAARRGRIRSLGLILPKSRDFGRDRQGRTFVHYAASAGHAHIVRQWASFVRAGLFSREFPLDNDYNSPLHFAAAAGHTHMIPLFEGCIYESNKQGEFPLHLAARGGWLDFVKKLVQAGAKLRSISHRLYTPLHEAVEARHVALVHFFIEEGVEADAWYPRGLEFGPTAMELAIKLKDAEIISLLEKALKDEKTSD